MLRCTWLLMMVVGAWSAPAEDLITSLPGLDYEVPFKQYSGHLNGLEGQHLFYWFVESQRDPTSDPIILWLDGGPGCSSMDGNINELGPFTISREDEVSLIQNPYSWNLNASVIFMDAPICVGYSYSDNGSCESDDDTTSMANYLAIQDFFTNKFPELYGLDFYIVGESYGGIYAPTLAQRVQEGQSTFPLELKGWATGNGMLNYRQSYTSLMFFAYHHGLFDDILWDKMVEHCCEGGVASKDTCNFFDPIDTNCIADVLQGQDAIRGGGLNPYNLYGRCEHAPESKNSEASTRMEQEMKYLYPELIRRSPKYQSFVRAVTQCFDDHIIENWFSRTDVREALHIPEQVPAQWLVCSDIEFTRLYTNMTSQFNYLHKEEVKGLVYNGDWDMMCNFLGNQWFLEDLGFTEVEKHREWYYDGQVAGFVKRWENLDFVKVKAAGHMVPENRPEQSLKMIYNWINGEPY
ncbi:unnamed protein product [Meganyctiphanes norvegica]|uniref:Carboxypeptidase n=1 Tax=Meganyctiphanes norvegica TaxID=48144 RepID=A0AAV2R0X5_MEGNR